MVLFQGELRAAILLHLGHIDYLGHDRSRYFPDSFFALRTGSGAASQAHVRAPVNFLTRSGDRVI